MTINSVSTCTLCQLVISHYNTCVSCCWQGPLEKSMQNSAALEKQKNLDNKVAVIRSSVQVRPHIYQNQNRNVYIHERHIYELVTE